MPKNSLYLFERRLSDHLGKQGVAIPKNPTTAVLAEKSGLIDHIEAFLHTYPSQMLNATYAVGAAQLIRSGLQHNKHWDGYASAAR